MAICFLGYVLPWGQMSFWGATVITNLLSPIPLLVNWICGGYYICNATLKRFFVLHFALTFFCLVVLVLHIFYLHLQGSLNPLGYNSILKIPFYANILMMDVKGLSTISAMFIVQTMLGLLTLVHPDNACEVNRFQTPLQIVPEWYFLSFYAMLKVIPSKNAGLLIATASILFLLLLGEQRETNTLINQNTSYINHFRLMLLPFYCLWLIGAELPQETFITYGRIFLVYYFLFGLVTLTYSTVKR